MFQQSIFPQLVVVFAALAVPRAASAAPRWCGAYKSPGDNKAKFIDDRLKGGYSLENLSYIADAACDKPDDPKRAEQVARWRSGYLGGLLSDKQWQETMATLVVADTYKKQLEALCKTLETNPSMSVDQRIRKNAYATAYRCSSAKSEAADDFVAWADWENTTQVERVLMLSNTHAHIGYYPLFAHDLKALDLAKLVDEVSSSAPLERVMLLRLGGLAKVAGDYDKALGEMLKQSPKYREVLAAADAGWDAWEQTYAANKDVMELARSFENKFFSDDKASALKGCEQALWKPLAAHIAAQKPKDLAHAQAAANDMLSFRLLTDLVLCSAGNDVPVNAHGFAEGSMGQQWRGPRFAAMNYARAKFTELKAAFSGDPEAPSGSLLTYAYKDVEDGYHRKLKYSFVNERAQVGSTKKASGDNVVLSFAKVKLKIALQECTEDTKSWEVVGPGQVRHPVYCRPNGQFATDSAQQPPLTVSSYLAAKLKKGTFVKWWYDEAMSKPFQGFPRESYSDGAQTKLVGYLGAAW